MAPNTSWNTFRKLRIVLLAFASIISLIWCIIIAVYMANNWSGYNSGERGFLFGLIALDFIQSILLYLMIVVQYQFWPDATRAIILFGLNVAGAVAFMVLSPKFPCSAFGSTTNCHNMTMAVLVGSWVISALLLLYAICLLFVPFIPRPPSPTQADDLENKADVVEVTDDLRMSHVSSMSHDAWLLKNEEGMSPEVYESELPFPSHIPTAHRVLNNALSFSSLQMPQQATSDDTIELETPSAASDYSDASARSSIVRTIRAPDGADESSSASGSSSPRQYPHRSHSLPSSALPDHFIGESNFYGSTYEFPTVAVPLAKEPHRTLSVITGSSASIYSQRTIPARVKTTSSLRTRPFTSPSTSRSPGQLSAHSAMMTSLHEHAEDQAAGGSNEPTFELHLSNVPRRESKELIEFPRDIVQDPVQYPKDTIGHPRLMRPSLQHLRNDSTSSNVDLDEWKRLVLSAAGREHE